MESIRVALPTEIPKCTFTLDPVVEAVRTVCGHFFERNSFEEYGGKNCIVCKQEITWYADVPEDMWGKEVELQPKPVTVKHRPVESHMDHLSLEDGIAKNLICIAVACGDEAFEKWCSSKNSGVVAQLNYDQPIKKGWIEGLKKYPTFVQRLFQAYNYEAYDEIQPFINAFLKKPTNFEIYNFLAERVYLDTIHEGVEALWGHSPTTASFDESRVIADVEGRQRLCALMGLSFALCLIIGLSRRLLQRTT